MDVAVVERNVDGIAWREAGSGDPLIFLHAMVGSSTAWEPQFERFSGSYRCIAWDMPGFGGSRPLHDAAEMDEVVAELKRFVTVTLGLHSAHFVGLSVGGMILQHFAVRNSPLVRSLTLMDSSPKFGLSGGITATEFIDPIVDQLTGGVTVEKFSSDMVAAVVGPKCSDAVRRRAVSAMARAEVEGLLLCARLIGHHDALAILNRILAQTLVVVGADDVDTPLAYALRLADDIIGARVSVIPAAGHLSNLENPDAVNDALAAFLRSVGGV